MVAKINIKKIIFDALGLIPIHLGSLTERPLGGTEVGVIELASELARRGYEVYVRTALNEVPQAIPQRPKFVTANSPIAVDDATLVIVVQTWRRIYEYPAALPLIYWTGDGHEQVSNLGIGDPRFSNRVKAMLVASEYHRQSLNAASGFPMNKSFVVGNGVRQNQLEDFLPKSNNPGFKFVYHAAPYRGLVHLFKIFKMIKEFSKDSELHIYSDMELYSRGTTKYSGPHAGLITKLYAEHHHMEGVFFNATVPQNKVNEILKDKDFFIYPCNVPETFSMCMAEAMYSGVVPIVPSIGALAEILGEGSLVSNSSCSSSEFASFVSQRIKYYLENKPAKENLAEVLKRRIVENYTWPKVADRLLEVVRNVC